MRNWLTVLVIMIAASSPSLSASEKDILDLEQYRDQVIYVDFWASWCTPCRKSFPWMNQMQEKYKDQGLRIVAVNVDTDAAAADKFLADYSVNFTILRDPEGKLAEKYDLMGMPTSLTFDTQGKLVKRHVGFRKSQTQKYETELRKLLPNDTLAKVH